MCGIVGYIGNGDTKNMLIDSLGMLEYRGYDSAGLALVCRDDLKIIKTCDRVAKLREIVPNSTFAVSGIGHTRWATHGKPSDINAHPHRDCTGKIAVVHNGIIENYRELKEMLVSRGHRFVSETDTEVVSHLIEEYYSGDMKNAITETVRRLKGSFALVVAHKDLPEKLFAVKNESPLVIGICKDQCFVASDAVAFLKYTKKIVTLEDRDIAIISRGMVNVYDFDGNAVERTPRTASWHAEEIGTGVYAHYMLKEIHEQPRTLSEVMANRLDDTIGNIDLPELSPVREALHNIRQIVIVACGTSYHAGIIGKYAMEQLLNMPVSVEIASEFRYALHNVGTDTLVIAITQSGETADTIAAAKEATHKGACVVAVTNAEGSSITRECRATIFMKSGIEIGVAATKTFTAQVLVLYLLALYLGKERGTLMPKEMAELMSSMRSLPQKVQRVLDEESYIKNMASLFSHASSMYFIGRSMNYPVALEGSLKLKEIAYVFSEGFAAGELKHGPIALITADVPVVAIMTRSSTYDKTASNVKEILARDAVVIAIASEGDNNIRQLANLVISVPNACEYTSPILSSVALQLFSYYIALLRGCPIDKPRNLAKSVTVE